MRRGCKTKRKEKIGGNNEEDCGEKDATYSKRPRRVSGIVTNVREEEEREEHATCEGRDVGKKRNIDGDVDEHDLAVGLRCGGEMRKPEGLKEGCKINGEDDVENVHGFGGIVARKKVEENGED